MPTFSSALYGATETAAYSSNTQRCSVCFGLAATVEAASRRAGTALSHARFLIDITPSPRRRRHTAAISGCSSGPASRPSLEQESCRTSLPEKRGEIADHCARDPPIFRHVPERAAGYLVPNTNVVP